MDATIIVGIDGHGGGRDALVVPRGPRPAAGDAPAVATASAEA